MSGVRSSFDWEIGVIPYDSDDREKPPVGTLKNIRISDVVAEVTIEDREKATRAAYKNIKVEDAPGITDKEKSKAGPIMITGIPGHYVENVTIAERQDLISGARHD